MAGLLGGDFNDPKTQGLLSLALGLLASSGPSRTPTTLGANLGQAGLGAMQAYQGAQDRQRAIQLDALRQKLIQSQVEENTAQAEQRKAALAQAVKAQAATEDYMKYLATPQFQPGATVMRPETMQGAQAPQFNPIEALSRGVPIGVIKEMDTFTQPKYQKIGPDESLFALDRSGKATRLAGGGLNPNKPFSIGPNGEIVPNKAFQDYELGKAQAGAAKQMTLVNAFEPASVAAQKSFIEAAQKRFDELRDAKPTLDNIEKAKALIPKAVPFVGSGADMKLAAAKFLNNNLGLGIDVESVKSAEELRTRLFEQIKDGLKKMDAQPSEVQQKIMMDALGRLGTDPAALPGVLNVIEEQIRSKVEAHNRKVSQAMQNGIKFPFDPRIDLTGQNNASADGVRRYNPLTGRIE